MELHINGQTHVVPLGTSVSALLGLLNVKAPKVAVELNAEVVVKARYDTTILQPGDQVEIVTFVGGG